MKVEGSTLANIRVPDDGEITVCGDVHGQYYDLLNIWSMNGVPSEKNPYIFNGDFVDRGSFSVEVILMLFAWKLTYPQHLHLARGNHETKNMNKLYGFMGECTKKYDEDLYHLMCEAFCLLPLCHVINSQIFCVHGGLFSSDNVSLDSIAKVDRVREPPDEGLMTEMLWSDPQPAMGRAASKRGVGVAFGQDVTENFLQTNGLKMVIRSHEMKEEGREPSGYEIEHSGKLVTVFSAPNYCDQMGNKGAYIRLDGKTLTPKYTSFDAVAHPNVKAMRSEGVLDCKEALLMDGANRKERAYGLLVVGRLAKIRRGGWSCKAECGLLAVQFRTRYHSCGCCSKSAGFGMECDSQRWLNMRKWDCLVLSDASGLDCIEWKWQSLQSLSVCVD
eukprot:4917355-Amphidinium_carterae.1